MKLGDSQLFAWLVFQITKSKMVSLPNPLNSGVVLIRGGVEIVLINCSVILTELSKVAPIAPEM